MKNDEVSFHPGEAIGPPEASNRNSQGPMPWAQAILDELPDPILLVDPKGTLLFLNKAAAKGFGRSIPLIGQRIDQLEPGPLPPDSVEILLGHIGAVVSSRQPVRVQYDLKGRVFDTHYHPVLDRYGRVAYISIAAYDISEKNQYPQATKDSDREGHPPIHVDQKQLPIRRALTPTEITVLQLLLKGKSTKEIAGLLHRSCRTVEVHRSHLMHKLGAHNAVDLVRQAIYLGLSDGVSGQ